MADFFSLGHGRLSETTNNDQEHLQNQNDNTQSNPNIITESWFSLFRNEEMIQPYKELELWQPQLSTTPHQHHHHHHLHHHPEVEDSLGFLMVRQGGNNGGGISCQDCGNQAKKDCVHMRCRTCCKSRGFECQTHVKSTWVPASERRKRQVAANNNSSSHEQHLQQEEEDHLLLRGTQTKRLREIHSPSLEVGSLPQEANKKASFRRIRVETINNNTQEEYAYQGVVEIEGHVFKGILYDQSPGDNQYMAGETSNNCGGATVAGGCDGGGQLVSVIPRATTTTATPITTARTPDGGCLASETPFLDHTLFSAHNL